MCFFPDTTGKNISNLSTGVHTGENRRHISIRKFKRKVLINWARNISYFLTIKSIFHFFPCASNYLRDLSTEGRPDLHKWPEPRELPNLTCTDGWNTKQSMQNVLQEAFKVQIKSFFVSMIIKVARFALYNISHVFHEPGFSILLED